jgi:hypothetical protein
LTRRDGCGRIPFVLLKVFDDFLAAYHRKSVDMIVDLYSTDATLTDPQAAVWVPGSGGGLNGRKEIAVYYDQVFRSLPHEPTPQILKRIISRPNLVVELEEQKVRTCHIVEIRNDHILTHRIYLGSLPNEYVLDKLLRLR